MTKEECYQAIKEHFSKEGAVFSIEGYNDGQCYYRLNNDPKSPIRCPLGVCIPDNLYFPALEGQSSTVIFGIREPTKQKWTDEEKKILLKIRESIDDDAFLFLSEVQVEHDINAHSTAPDAMEDFLRNLDDIAEQHGILQPVSL